MSEQAPFSEETTGLGVFKIILLVLILLVVGFVVLNQMGVKVTETSESVEIINRPQPSNKTWDEFKEKKDRQQKEREARTKVAEHKLHSFVQDYRKTGDRDLKQAEIKFLEKMDKKVQKESSTIETAAQYYSFMRKSMKFYDAMKRFSNMTAKSATPSVQYPTTSEEADIYIDRIFNVEQEKLEIFTEGDPDPEEWMEFLEEE